jgi:uncharacterized protein (TIGR03437 family)
MKFVMTCFTLILVFAAYTPRDSRAQSQTPSLVGHWKVEFKFSNTEEHALRFDVRAEGKGAFLLLDVVSSLNPPAEPTKAQWERAASDQVTFSGEIVFPIGNVGRDAGTLVFSGRVESASSISGKVAFFRVGQDPKDLRTIPSKTGDFSAKRIATSSVRSVSAASYRSDALACQAIIAAFGSNLTTTTQSAATLPLPTSLAGTSVVVQASDGVERLASLFYVSPTQVNYQIPAGTVTGSATIVITSAGGSTAVEETQIAAVAPGLFSANASGEGVAAAAAFRVKADGGQSYEPVAQFDAAQKIFVPIPIDLGPETDQVFLILFGTGIRGRTALSAVTARIGGTDSEVLFAGSQTDFVGLDQVNLRLDRTLIGRGEVDISLKVDRQTANVVNVKTK